MTWSSEALDGSKIVSHPNKILYISGEASLTGEDITKVDRRVEAPAENNDRS